MLRTCWQLVEAEEMAATKGLYLLPHMLLGMPLSSVGTQRAGRERLRRVMGSADRVAGCHELQHTSQLNAKTRSDSASSASAPGRAALPGVLRFERAQGASPPV